MIDQMPCDYGTPSTTAVRIWLQVSCRAAQRFPLLSKSPTDLRRGLSHCKIWPSYKSNLEACWMHLPYCIYFMEHMRMLLQSLGALSGAPGGSGNIWKYVEALARLTGVSGRYMCGFRTDFHFADEYRVSLNNLRILLDCNTRYTRWWRLSEVRDTDHNCDL